MAQHGRVWGFPMGVFRRSELSIHTPSPPAPRCSPDLAHVAPHGRHALGADLPQHNSLRTVEAGVCRLNGHLAVWMGST